MLPPLCSLLLLLHLLLLLLLLLHLLLLHVLLMHAPQTCCERRVILQVVIQFLRVLCHGYFTYSRKNNTGE